MNLSNYCHPTCLLDRPDLLSGFVPQNQLPPCGIINCTLCCQPYMYTQLMNNGFQSPVLVLSPNSNDSQSINNTIPSTTLPPNSSYCVWLNQSSHDLYKQIYPTSHLMNGSCTMNDLQSCSSTSTSSCSSAASSSSISLSTASSSVSPSVPSSTSPKATTTASSVVSSSSSSSSSAAAAAVTTTTKAQTVVVNISTVGSPSTTTTTTPNMLLSSFTDSFGALSLETNMYSPLTYCDGHYITNPNVMLQMVPHNLNATPTTTKNAVVSSSVGYSSANASGLPTNNFQPMMNFYSTDKFYDPYSYTNYLPYYSKSILSPVTAAPAARYTVMDEYNTSVSASTTTTTTATTITTTITTNTNNSSSTVTDKNGINNVDNYNITSVYDDCNPAYQYTTTPAVPHQQQQQQQHFNQYINAYNMNVIRPFDQSNAQLLYSLLTNQQLMNTVSSTPSTSSPCSFSSSSSPSSPPSSVAAVAAAINNYHRTLLCADAKTMKYSLQMSSTPSPSTHNSSPMYPFDLSRLLLSVNPINLDLSLFENSRYFMIKSDYAYNVSQSMKYGVWCSTRTGNQCLNEAYQSMHGSQGSGSSSKQPKGHIILFFSIRESGYLSGVAEMTSTVNLQKRAGIWQDLRFRGEFSVKWLYIKHIPNYLLKHILIESYDNRPVTVLRDTSEILPPSKGEELLRIVHNYKPHSLDTFTMNNNNNNNNTPIVSFNPVCNITSTNYNTNTANIAAAAITTTTGAAVATTTTSVSSVSTPTNSTTITTAATTTTTTTTTNLHRQLSGNTSPSALTVSSSRSG